MMIQKTRLPKLLRLPMFLIAVLCCAKALAADDTATVPSAGSQQVVDLGNGATLTVYLPAASVATGKAVVICPGGGYGQVCTSTEGTPIAEHLVKRGVAGFVLKYRLPQGKHDVPGTDARAAVKMVRTRAKDWAVDTTKIGIWGFSAGGHLAATVGTLAKDDERPDFQILFYPVISMQTDITHGGSRKNLLGEAPEEGLVERFSLQTQVTKDTAPAFLLHAASDKAVDVRNSLRYYESLLAHDVPAVMHVFQRGGHGPGAFKQNPSWEVALDEWLEGR